ncbi:MAG TPA: S-methyl-5'-thioadenosine phosphorylase [Dehalococcoidia bacterium]|jgi:5'-methylthioadenosine phosphorylase|nr:S-methyl-5'-thioadenosine phosphorylase [Chloroflexota bacterium]MDP5877105.1 S-methyl-5'-thioadenosine phosphorylase [Dehalococcoidia bacterium]MDP6274497.1 S-methyl-5'-thioadenosine phosphorylase [Dehalococcoidia bacterium]MDP7161102.1 S-methyl-5'-thioadenosine phosphorylase [Dehalococcoidia bacterium]MDP7213988.1 S-methyl-5'-thioadenosine phosphorylase [Dehalococcoidia bacterium]|tara:strand:- start:212 stop:1105 length:894 start_codon:yes stop_codon:yes gene_type:complete
MSQIGDGDRPLIGMIGGSGLYDMEGLSNTQWVKIESAYGEPSDALLFGEIDGIRIVFLPRHGRGHRIPPSQINYRANIDAMKRAGVTDVLSFSAVGSLRKDLAPGAFVLVDQFIDRTFAREKSFFGEGLAAHVAVAHPTCARLGDALMKASESQDVDVRRGGTYLAIEGPQFSTLAESNLYRQWGCDVIGMTNMPEAKLAREAEICYATMAMVTDFDTWHPDHDSVTVEMIIKVLSANAQNAATLARRAVPGLQDRPDACPNGCDRVLDTAIITAANARDPEMVAKLGAVAGRVLRA